MVAHKFWLGFQFVDVVNRFRWWWALFEELRRGAVAQHCVCVVVDNLGNERDPPQVGVWASPAAKYCSTCDCHLCFVGVIYVELIFVEDGDIVGVGELGYAQQRVALDARYDVDVLRGVADVVVEFVHVRGWFDCSIWHVECPG